MSRWKNHKSEVPKESEKKKLEELKVIEASIPIADINEAKRKVLFETQDLSEKVSLLLDKFEMENPGTSVVEILFDNKEVHFMFESYCPAVPCDENDKLKQAVCTLVNEFKQRNPGCLVSKITTSAEGTDVRVLIPSGYGRESAPRC